ncbi:MAG: sortase domain-containing protein [Candidatus Saccharibacteria bacterium]
MRGKVRVHFSWQKIIAAGAALLIISGGLYLGVPAFQAWQHRQQGNHQNAQLLQKASRQTVAINNNFTLTEPVQLSLPRLNITLQIDQGVYYPKTQTWLLDRTHAFIMPGTTMPIIYGHDIPSVFEHLNGVAANEILTVTQKDGTTYVLKYVGDVAVAPQDTRVLNAKIPNSILLMTCTGTHFEKRRVLQFTLVGQQNVATLRKDNHADLA